MWNAQEISFGTFTKKKKETDWEATLRRRSRPAIMADRGQRNGVRQTRSQSVSDASEKSREGREGSNSDAPTFNC